MTILSLEVKDMPKMDLFGWCDPYIKIFTYHESDKALKTLIHQTPIEHNTKDASYPDFSLDEAMKSNNLNLTVNSSMFLFEVWDFDHSSSDDFIGSIEISYSKLTEEKINEFVFPLKAGGELLVNAGEINISTVWIESVYTSRKC